MDKHMKVINVKKIDTERTLIQCPNHAIRCQGVDAQALVFHFLNHRTSLRGCKIGKVS